MPIEVTNLRSVVVEAIEVYEANVPQFLQANDSLSGTQQLERVGQVVWRDRVELPEHLFPGLPGEALPDVVFFGDGGAVIQGVDSAQRDRTNRVHECARPDRFVSQGQEAGEEHGLERAALRARQRALGGGQRPSCGAHPHDQL